MLVSEIKYIFGFNVRRISYEYDAVGNIKEVVDGINGFRSAYTYDKQNQLTHEVVGNSSETHEYAYTYDTFGNIREKTYKNPDGAVKKNTYTYSSAGWLDLLMAYNGKPITYDEIGNPWTYHDGTNFTWEKGRRLSKAVNKEKNLTLSYTYDVDGTRIGKTVSKDGSTTEHKYYVQNSKIVAEKRGNDILEYIYDENGKPLQLIYNGTKYTYITNLQGDVVQIRDAGKKIVAEYAYNAWGEVIYVSGASIKDVNPLRYRGYYYDTETGLYYLNSRYYDPATCRFINADDTDVLSVDQDNLLQHNLFTYCLNNPVNFSDHDGESAAAAALTWGVSARIMALIAAAGSANFWNPLGWTVLGVTAAVAAGYLIYRFAKGGKQNKRDTGLIGVSNEELARRYNDPATSKQERQRIKTEQKARDQRNSSQKNKSKPKKKK